MVEGRQQGEGNDALCVDALQLFLFCPLFRLCKAR
jgi:hypothetical protein